MHDGQTWWILCGCNKRMSMSIYVKRMLRHKTMKVNNAPIG